MDLYKTIISIQEAFIKRVAIKIPMWMRLTILLPLFIAYVIFIVLFALVANSIYGILRLCLAFCRAMLNVVFFDFRSSDTDLRNEWNNLFKVG